MALEQGEQYQCMDQACGCRIEVVKGPDNAGGDLNPRCCCGTEMKPV